MAPFATIASTSTIHHFIQRRMRGRGVLREEKRITLVILNENMCDITIIKSLENLGFLTDGVSETVKQNKITSLFISRYAIRNFSCFNLAKYVS